jgi:hypothetical protein
MSIKIHCLPVRVIMHFHFSVFCSVVSCGLYFDISFNQRTNIESIKD